MYSPRPAPMSGSQSQDGSSSPLSSVPSDFPSPECTSTSITTPAKQLSSLEEIHLSSPQLPQEEAEKTDKMSPKDKPRIKVVAGRRKIVPKKKSKWDAETILTDPKSPLASADLRVTTPFSYFPLIY